MKEAQYTLHRQELERLANTAHAASTDEARQVLTCVAVYVGPKALWAVATDSYMMVVNHVTDEKQRHKKPWSVLVSGDLLRKVIGRCKRKDLYAITVSDAGIEIETDEGTTNLGVVEGTFPAWADIVTKAIKKPVPERSRGFTINPAFVARLGKALSCSVENPLTLCAGDPLEALLAGPLLGKSFGFLMPIRAWEEPSKSATVYEVKAA